MSRKADQEVRKFFRLAVQRLEESRFLLNHGFSNAAVYLGGFAVECVLKSLIFSYEPKSKHELTLRSFLGLRGHDFEWLRNQLARRKCVIPAQSRKQLHQVSWWTTSIRYDPRMIQTTVAKDFLACVENILNWATRRL